jgi:hypothetical protein
MRQQRTRRIQASGHRFLHALVDAHLFFCFIGAPAQVMVPAAFFIICRY